MTRTVVVIIAVGVAIFDLPRVMSDPLEDGLSAMIIADYFKGGEDRGAALGVADEAAGFAAFMISRGGGDGEETDGGDDG